MTTTTCKTFLEKFIDASENSFQKIAIELDDQSWTYAESLSNVLCVVHQLRHINEGDLVYLFTKTSFEKISALIGICCAGRTFFPLSPSASLTRIRSLMDEYPSEYVLLHEKTRAKFNEINDRGITVINLESILTQNVSTTNVDEIRKKKNESSFYSSFKKLSFRLVFCFQLLRLIINNKFILIISANLLVKMTSLRLRPNR